jgi:hypothetical protein
MSDDCRQLLQLKVAELRQKLVDRDQADLEIAKLKSLILAGLKMLPASEKDAFERQLDELETRPNALTDAVRGILQGAPPGVWITGHGLRVRLMETGFDFSSHNSNPLASIYAAAKSFKRAEVETSVTDGSRAFRWIGKTPKIEPVRSRTH